MVAAQGGDASYIDAIEMNKLCKVKKTVEIYPPADGYITAIVAEKIGHAAQRLGAGRAVEGEKIDPAVGLVMHKRLGDMVCKTQPIATFYVNNEEKLPDALSVFYEAFTIEAAYQTPAPLVYDVIRDESAH